MLHKLVSRRSGAAARLRTGFFGTVAIGGSSLAADAKPIPKSCRVSPPIIAALSKAKVSTRTGQH